MHVHEPASHLEEAGGLFQHLLRTALHWMIVKHWFASTHSMSLARGFPQTPILQPGTNSSCRIRTCSRVPLRAICKSTSGSRDDQRVASPFEALAAAVRLSSQVIVAATVWATGVVRPLDVAASVQMRGCSSQRQTWMRRRRLGRTC